MSPGPDRTIETKKIALGDLRASKSCFVCGAVANERIRPPVALGVRLAWNILVPACEDCLGDLRKLDRLPFYMRRLTIVALPTCLAVLGTFLLPTQGMIPSHGPVVTACVFAVVWAALLVAIHRYRRHRVEWTRGLVVGVDEGALSVEACAPAGNGKHQGRLRRPVDRVGTPWLILAFIVGAITTTSAWSGLYANVIVTNRKGVDCELSIDGSHVQLPLGWSSFHARAGGRLIVITCTVGRNFPDYAFNVRFSSDQTVYIDTDELSQGRGVHVRGLPGGWRQVFPPRSRSPF